MNRKGFMMAELVVVSSVILITLVSLYTSYNKIYSVYNTRLKYYDVVTLYRLGYYRDILRENELLEVVIADSIGGYAEVYNSKSSSGSVFSLPSTEQTEGFDDVVFLINNEGNSINKNLFDDMDLHVTFLDYIDFLNDSVDFSEINYMMIMERCIPGDENSCNYAYLEIYEE